MPKLKSKVDFLKGTKEWLTNKLGLSLLSVTCKENIGTRSVQGLFWGLATREKTANTLKQ